MYLTFIFSDNNFKNCSNNHIFTNIMYKNLCNFQMKSLCLKKSKTVNIHIKGAEKINLYISQLHENVSKNLGRTKVFTISEKRLVK